MHELKELWHVVIDSPGYMVGGPGCNICGQVREKCGMCVA